MGLLALANEETESEKLLAHNPTQSRILSVRVAIKRMIQDLRANILDEKTGVLLDMALEACGSTIDSSGILSEYFYFWGGSILLFVVLEYFCVSV